MSHTENSVETAVIRVEQLTPEAFAPYGVVLTAEGQEPLPITMYGDRFRVYRPAPLEADQPLEWLLNEADVRDFEVLFLERHLGVCQAFIPLGGNPWVLAVAAPDAELRSDVPAPETVHAFLIPAGHAVQMHLGTWHEPPFPVAAKSLLLSTSHEPVTRALQTELDEHGGIQRLDVDKRHLFERSGIHYRIAF